MFTAAKYSLPYTPHRVFMPYHNSCSKLCQALHLKRKVHHQQQQQLVLALLLVLIVLRVVLAL
jgi:predicted nucleic acid-binding Zn ribbon protein